MTVIKGLYREFVNGVYIPVAHARISARLLGERYEYEAFANDAGLWTLPLPFHEGFWILAEPGGMEWSGHLPAAGTFAINELIALYGWTCIKPKGATSANVFLDFTNTPIVYGGKSVELDFGSRPTRCKMFTIYDNLVVPTSRISALQSGDAPLGKSADENEMDTILLNCSAAEGQFRVNAYALEGPVVGNFKINYQVL